ncbi:hypothetical protein CspeluHIS016_0113120 [Cutaneotrichosporon spelunceum]|uniref:Glycoside hydrolase family 5 C-terminal domain-containing protein n=1 Tax=Cutaneotrichosporon spelunceum TaxID=1672016 RepID=A0AAD3Y9C1_9TREE|nr:hypothetical protein CspeluHIS016_0113120 [Cutaneotrichosporon spelunceum]
MSLDVDLGKRAVAVDTAQFELFSPNAGNINILGRHFVDQHGRVLLLHGANVGAASKVPNEHGLEKPEEASYIGRPFPLEEAKEHWARLASWGLTFVRIIFTWDAVEHAGPGEYDEAYLAYLRALLTSLRGTGLVAYVSVHQDVWSRYSGGSGAPAWTLSLAGFDMSNGGEKLEVSGAAWLHGVQGGRLPGERGLWPTGYQKLACASMNTFFWGGETFAPSLKVGPKGVNIQTFLQDAFLAMWSKVLDTVGDLETVMGFQMLNEPHGGYIGVPTIDEWNYNTDLHLGEYPSPLQSFSLGDGHPTKVPVYERSWPHPTRVSRYSVANKSGARAWTIPCPWEKEGVWSWSADQGHAVALQQDYFTKNAKGEPVSFYKDCYYPFVRRWDKLVNSKAPKKARLLEPIPNEYAPVWPEDARPRNFVYAPHWYDLHALFTKTFGTMTVNVQGLSRGKFLPMCLYFGKSVRQNYATQIRTLVQEAGKQLGDVPVVFGECGIPFDLNGEEALRTGDWKWQRRMLDALMYALETNNVHFNLWNYNPSNRDELGDDWNAESFSWFSEENRQRAITAAPAEEQKAMTTDLDLGARLLDVLVRPYAIATAGTPLSTSFEPTTMLFSHRWTDMPQPTSPDAPARSRLTEIFLPGRHYKEGQVKWFASSGGRMHFDWERQRLWVWFDDTDESINRGKAVTRRVDLWVHDARDRAKPVEVLGLLIVVGGFCFFLANEWQRYTTGKPWVEMVM